MSQLMQWVSMHGYALYIWPAYGIVTGALIWTLFDHKRQKEHVYKQLKKWYQGNHS